jgi:hypothetical protein
MSLQELATQAAAERAERRKHWAIFRRMSPDTLQELLGKSISDEQRASLQEYLLLERRERKAELEEQEKEGDFREKAALPSAAAASFFGSWSATLAVVPPAWKPWLILGFGLFGAVLWLFLRKNALRLVTDARKQLAFLGKVD